MSGKCQEFVWWSKQTYTVYTQVLKLYIACVHFKEVLSNNDVSNSICVIVLLTVYLYLALLRSLICDSKAFERSHCPQAWIQIQHVCSCRIIKRDDDHCMLTRSLFHTRPHVSCSQRPQVQITLKRRNLLGDIICNCLHCDYNCDSLIFILFILVHGSSCNVTLNILF